MDGINAGWAIPKLEEYLETIELQHVPSPPGVVSAGHDRLVRDEQEAIRATQVAEQILDRVLPEWRHAEWPLSRKPLARQRMAAQRAIAQLEAAEELAVNLGPVGPSLAASSFHPWVWDGASSLWSSSHYREAVGAALRSVNAHAQDKLGRRDASESKLLSDAFSSKEPTGGHPRLRLHENDGSDTFANVHEGAGAFARGLFLGVRNPLAHDDAQEWPEQEALEHLAAISVLARWIDAARLSEA